MKNYHEFRVKDILPYLPYADTKTKQNFIFNDDGTIARIETNTFYEGCCYGIYSFRYLISVTTDKEGKVSVLDYLTVTL